MVVNWYLVKDGNVNFDNSKERVVEGRVAENFVQMGLCWFGLIGNQKEMPNYAPMF